MPSVAWGSHVKGIKVEEGNVLCVPLTGFFNNLLSAESQVCTDIDVTPFVSLLILVLGRLTRC